MHHFVLFRFHSGSFACGKDNGIFLHKWTTFREYFSIRPFNGVFWLWTSGFRKQTSAFILRRRWFYRVLLYVPISFMIIFCLFLFSVNFLFPTTFYWLPAILWDFSIVFGKSGHSRLFFIPLSKSWFQALSRPSSQSKVPFPSRKWSVGQTEKKTTSHSFFDHPLSRNDSGQEIFKRGKVVCWFDFCFLSNSFWWFFWTILF